MRKEENHGKYYEIPVVKHKESGAWLWRPPFFHKEDDSEYHLVLGLQTSLWLGGTTIHHLISYTTHSQWKVYPCLRNSPSRPTFSTISCPANALGGLWKASVQIMAQAILCTGKREIRDPVPKMPFLETVLQTPHDWWCFQYMHIQQDGQTLIQESSMVLLSLSVMDHSNTNIQQWLL